MCKPIKKSVAAYVPLLVAALVVTATPAEAAPNKIGPVKGLDVTITRPAERYVVASDWNDLAGATSYRVSLSIGGTVLQSDKVTTSDWRTNTTREAGARVTVKVVPLAGKKPGKQASLTKELPDLTAPTGAFHIQQAPGSQNVQVVQDTLSDDLTPAGSIARTISWDEGMPFEPWGGGTHQYTVDVNTALVYHPTVKLEDAAHNVSEVPLGAVVVGDNKAPTGAFGATSTGWARWTKIALIETSPVDDNFKDAENVITRTVDWGDNSSDTWTGSAAPTHVYADAGTYTPVVTLTDKAGNKADGIEANTVQVAADTGRPRVSLTKPSTRRTWVRKWATLHGKVSDAATGVKVVKLRMIEKRGTSWYAYRSSTHRWVRGGTTQAAALRSATFAKVKPTARNKWSYQVSGLRKGRFVVQARALDNVKNVSKLRTVSQALSHN
jgi:PKD domain